jgi:uncharacterized membrane protein
MLRPLLLTENTPIALAGLMILAPVVLTLCFPVLFLSRPASSWVAKLVALGLALLPLQFADDTGRELGALAELFFYLPLGFFLLNLMRGVYKMTKE